jgi:hypothetical protein
MSVELQKISGFLLFLVMKYVGGTAEDQWFSPVPCDELCQWNSTDIIHHKEQEKTTDLLQFH